MFEFELPDLGEGVAEGEVLAWHVTVGDTVTEDQVVAEVETDKAAVDVPAPVDGVVRELHAKVGDVLATGDVLLSIEETAAETEDTSVEGEHDRDSETTEASRVFAPPSVRRLARERGVDIATVDGSGPSGRITESDVNAAVTAKEDDSPTPVVSKVEETDSESDEGPKSVVSKVSDAEDDGPTSAVSKVEETDSESDDGPTSVVSKVEDTDESTASDDEQTVKSAVRRTTDESVAKRRDQTLATPATRRLARELDVDIDAVPTDETRDGDPYVDAAAVRAVARQRDEEIADEDVQAVAETVVSEMHSLADEVATEPTPVETSEGDHREPYSGVRRTIGEQMARSRREVPHATHHDQVIVSGLVEARERLQPLAHERGVRLTYTPLILRCVAAALDDHPILASQLDTEAEEILYRSDRHIGVATATDHGLVVPVVENVNEKGLLGLATELNDLIERARSRDIDREEMQGSVFTVTNVGAIGGEYVDPVINVPETAILGIGELRERPVVEDGDVVARPTLPLSLAIDHRVIDGADAAQFVNTLKSYLADPTRLLLE